MDSYYAYQEGKRKWEASGKQGLLDDFVDVEMKKRGYEKAEYRGYGVWGWVKKSQ